MRIAILLILSMSQAQDWFPLATSLAGNGTLILLHLTAPPHQLARATRRNSDSTTFVDK